MLNRYLVFSLVAIAVVSRLIPGTAADPTFTPEQIAFFEKDVRPILKTHCLKCHGEDPKKVRGGLNLTSRKSILDGGDTGSAVNIADPGKSLLLKAIHYKDEAYQMPPSGKLPAETVDTLEKWVKAGLPWTPGLTGTATQQQHAGSLDKSYWAYQPVKRPAAPVAKPANWIKTPIDTFILAKLNEKGLKPVTPATKAALCRRAYFDLTGLPPSPEQIERFVADQSPDAFEKLVDELLASPHYGEKWGRHWLDVVRFAESNGYERDGAKPYAWRYRDYVIRSFNTDKPYDRFVKEQIAGDELGGDDADAITATAFYRLGLWDDEPADRLLAMYEGYDDLVTVAGQGFLGMSLNCCRCHDHKGDFFPQADYYKMVAFFRDVRPHTYDQGMRSPSFTDITPAEQRKQYETELRERQDRLAELAKAMTAIEDAAIKKMPAEDQRASEGRERPKIVNKVPQFLSNPEKAEYQRLKRERGEIEKKPPPSQVLTLSVNNCEVRPPTTQILVRGNPHSPGKDVKPGFPTVFDVPEPVIPEPAKGAKTSGRRTVLANWLASKSNPLTARVMVNRVWHYHFGRGLVPTPNDFGKFGEPCSHPELLDWLAAEFMEPTASPGEPWSLKRLHRLIMKSSVYQQSAAADETNLKLDPSNRWRWRFDMRRLSAEEVRDSILTMSGNLNPKMYGPSMYPKIPPEVLAGISFGDKKNHWPDSPPTEANRRSVYAFVKRSLQVPILIAHDQADTDSSCPVRYTTTVPTQALGMLNGEFTNEQATTFAARLTKEFPGDLTKQIARGIQLTTGRSPAPAEVAKDAAFVNAMKSKHGLNDATALARFTLMLLKANEFAYLD